MNKKQILMGAIVVWFGLSLYWYICKIKGQCNQSSGNTIDVVNDTAATNAPTNYVVYFQPSSATNYTDGSTVDGELKKIADYIKANSDKQVKLTGYTANLGHAAGYQQMALARANVMKQKLVGLGVDATQVIVEARGIEGQASTASDEEKAKSRRVEIIVISK